MPLVHEEEDLLIWIDALIFQDVADLREGIVGYRDLDGVVGLQVLGDGILSSHLPMDSKKVGVTCRFVVDQSSERHGEDGMSRLLDGQGCRATTCDALVEHAVGRNGLHSLLVGEELCTFGCLDTNVIHNKLFKKGKG